MRCRLLGGGLALPVDASRFGARRRFLLRHGEAIGFLLCRHLPFALLSRGFGTRGGFLCGGLAFRLLLGGGLAFQFPLSRSLAFGLQTRRFRAQGRQSPGFLLGRGHALDFQLHSLGARGGGLGSSSLCSSGLCGSLSRSLLLRRGQPLLGLPPRRFGPCGGLLCGFLTLRRLTCSFLLRGRLARRCLLLPNLFGPCGGLPCGFTFRFLTLRRLTRSFPLRGRLARRRLLFPNLFGARRGLPCSFTFRFQCLTGLRPLRLGLSLGLCPRCFPALGLLRFGRLLHGGTLRRVLTFDLQARDLGTRGFLPCCFLLRHFLPRCFLLGRFLLGRDLPSGRFAHRLGTQRLHLRRRRPCGLDACRFRPRGFQPLRLLQALFGGLQRLGLAQEPFRRQRLLLLSRPRHGGVGSGRDRSRGRCGGSGGHGYLRNGERRGDERR